MFGSLSAYECVFKQVGFDRFQVTNMAKQSTADSIDFYDDLAVNKRLNLKDKMMCFTDVISMPFFLTFTPSLKK